MYNLKPVEGTSRRRNFADWDAFEIMCDQLTAGFSYSSSIEDIAVVWMCRFWWCTKTPPRIYGVEHNDAGGTGYLAFGSASAARTGVRLVPFSGVELSE